MPETADNALSLLKQGFAKNKATRAELAAADDRHRTAQELAGVQASIREVINFGDEKNITFLHELLRRRLALVKKLNRPSDLELYQEYKPTPQSPEKKPSFAADPQERMYLLGLEDIISNQIKLAAQMVELQTEVQKAITDLEGNEATDKQKEVTSLKVEADKITLALEGIRKNIAALQADFYPRKISELSQILLKKKQQIDSIKDEDARLEFKQEIDDIESEIKKHTEFIRFQELTKEISQSLDEINSLTAEENRVQKEMSDLRIKIIKAKYSHADADPMRLSLASLEETHGKIQLKLRKLWTDFNEPHQEFLELENAVLTAQSKDKKNQLVTAKNDKEKESLTAEIKALDEKIIENTALSKIDSAADRIQYQKLKAQQKASGISDWPDEDTKTTGAALEAFLASEAAAKTNNGSISVVNLETTESAVQNQPEDKKKNKPSKNINSERSASL